MLTILSIRIEAMSQDCCTDTISCAKWVSRAKWICPRCGRDVSLMYVLLAEAEDRWLIVHKGGDKEVLILFEVGGLAAAGAVGAYKIPKEIGSRMGIE